MAGVPKARAAREKAARARVAVARRPVGMRRIPPGERTPRAGALGPDTTTGHTVGITIDTKSACRSVAGAGSAGRDAMHEGGGSVGRATVWRTLTRRPPPLDFANRSILVTGASRGLGLEIAQQLAREGAR